MSLRLDQWMLTVRHHSHFESLIERKLRQYDKNYLPQNLMCVSDFQLMLINALFKSKQMCERNYIYNI